MSQKDAREALLAVHAVERQAHLDGDAQLLGTVFAEQVWEAGRGQLTRLAREELEQRFATYFKSVSYSVWDDLQPPHVVVSDDGRTAWMAVHIEARMAVNGDVSAQQQRAFESAWLATYALTEDRWLMVGISSSVIDR